MTNMTNIAWKTGKRSRYNSVKVRIERFAAWIRRRSNRLDDWSAQSRWNLVTAFVVLLSAGKIIAGIIVGIYAHLFLL